MALGLVVLLALVIAIVAGIMAIVRRMGGGGAETAGGTVRRIVVYLLLFGILVVAAVGVAQVVTLLIPGGRIIVDRGSSDVASALALTLVGVPVFLLLWRYVAGALDRDPGERRSPAWAVFVSLTGAVFLVGSMIGLGIGLEWLFGLDGDGRGALATGLVWGAVWVWSWGLLTGRRRPEMLTEAPVIIGSLVGLFALVAGVGSALDTLLSAAYDQVTGTSLGGTGIGGDLGRSLVWTALGGLVWWWHWLRHGRRGAPTALRNAYLLVVGVLGGAVAALGALGGILFSVLEWIFGDPTATQAARHFSDLPSQVTAFGLGTLIWAYHRSVVAEDPEVAHTDVGRTYRYLLSGVGLIAAASGLGVIVNALLAALVAPVAGGAVDVLLGGVTALVIGAPVWWATWSPNRPETSTEEIHSTPRRVYLTVLAGVGGITAIVSLIVLLFRLFEGVLEGARLGALIDAIRGPLGVLVATAILAWYHISLWRRERQTAPAPERARLRQVILVASDPEGLGAELRRILRTTVTTWSREGDGDIQVDLDAIVARLEAVESDRALILLSQGRAEVVGLTD